MGDPNEQRKHHERKPGQGTKFRGGHTVSTRAHPRVRAGNSEREPLIRTPMEEEVKLTGQWRHEGHTYHLFINQAGPHIELLFAAVVSGHTGQDDEVVLDQIRTDTRVARLGGDLDTSGDEPVYQLYLQHAGGPVDANDMTCGTLKHRWAGKKLKIDLELDVSGIEGKPKILPKLAKIASSTAVRIGEAANLFENHINHPWIPPEVRTALWFPLTPKQEARLPGFIFGARITVRADTYEQKEFGVQKTFGYVDMLRAYFVTKADTELGSVQRNQRLANAAAALDLLVLRGYQDALREPAKDGGIDPFHKDFWRLATLATLDDPNNSIRVTGAKTPQTLRTHTDVILDTAHVGVSMPWFKELLHLERRWGGHYYSAEIELVDIDGAKDDVGKLSEFIKKYVGKAAKKLAKRMLRYINAGGLAGVLVVRKQDDPALNPDANKQPPEWEAWFGVVLAGVKIGGSTGTSATIVHSTGEAKNVYGQAWRPEFMPGVTSLLEAGATIFGGGGGTAWSKTILTIYGTGSAKPRTPLHIDFSGFADIMGPGAGAGAAFVQYVGILIEGSTTFNPSIKGPPEKEVFEYEAQGGPGPMHFPINGAGLLPDGERVLQVFAGCELAILRRRGVKLQVDGYADQPHDVFHNLILSRNRAITVFNYLKNILGDDLGVPDLKPTPPEAEEDDSKKAAEAKGEVYSIVIPGSKRVIIEAHGEPKPKDGEKESEKPDYDATLRRVDLTVDGSIHLTLRRPDDSSSQ